MSTPNATRTLTRSSAKAQAAAVAAAAAAELSSMIAAANNDTKTMFKNGWPANAVVANYFQDAAFSLQNEENFADLFLVIILRPFRKAMENFRDDPLTGANLPFPETGNPFAAGIFSTTDEFPLSVWDMLKKSTSPSDKPPAIIYQHKLLLGLLVTWGFDAYDTSDLTSDENVAIYNELSAQGFLAKALDLDN